MSSALRTTASALRYFGVAILGIPLAVACQEYRIFGDDEKDGNSVTDTSEPEDTDDTDDTENDETSEDNPRDPEEGDLVITELMINPDATADEDGEWIEIYNGSNSWLDLAYHHIADDDVDNYKVDRLHPDSLVVGPGGYLVICADKDSDDNGGAECDGSYVWNSFGDGFALSNTSDQVRLLDTRGNELDRVDYGEGFSQVGVALGLLPTDMSATLNDDVGNWCSQWSVMSGGDAGTPGEVNDLCD